MASTGLRVATSVTWSSMGGWRGPAGRGGSVEERQLLPPALDLGVEPEVRRQAVEVGALAGNERTQMIGLEDMPVVRFELPAQERRALELEAHQLDPLRKDDQEAHQLLVVGDARPTLEEHVAEHGRPLDLEEEGGPVAQVPDDVHGLEDLPGALRDQRQIGALLRLREEAAQRSTLVRPLLFLPRHPAAQPQPVAVLHEQARQLGVLGVARLQLVVRAQQVGRGGPAAVAVETGPHERLVGRVVAAEHRADAVEEGALGEATGGGEQAEDGPFDAIGEGLRGHGYLALVAQPPSAG